MNLYENIKKAALEKGYSINRLEKELGFARSSIAKYDVNTPGIDKIKTIADFLHVPMDYLVTGIPDGCDFLVTVQAERENLELTAEPKERIIEMLTRIRIYESKLAAEKMRLENMYAKIG